MWPSQEEHRKKGGTCIATYKTSKLEDLKLESGSSRPANFQPTGMGRGKGLISMIWAFLVLLCNIVNSLDHSHLEQSDDLFGQVELQRNESAFHLTKALFGDLEFDLKEIHSEGQRNLDGHHSALDKGSCSTWSTGHFSTFDNYLYDFSGTCNYIFATVCDETSPDFNIQFRRGLNKRIERIIIQTGPNTIIVDKSGISIKDYGKIQLPFTGNGIQIAPFGHNIRLISKRKEMELAVFWNNDDYLMVLIEQKYMAKTCGLCGNFDGQELNEFLSEGMVIIIYYNF
ncbi:hypothetical protein Chor_016356 [Crotalus horridus]